MGALTGTLGRKAGMTQVFDDAGVSLPVTVVEAPPCPVVAVRTTEKNGYRSVALGFGAVGEKHVTKPRRGQFPKGVAPTRFIREFRVGEGDLPEVGAQVGVQEIVKAGDIIDVTGLTKGKGFQGPVKRHGFRGGPKSHGSNFHRRQGSIGPATDPGRVYPGRRMGGRMGAERRVIRNLRVVEVDGKEGILLVYGSVPGPQGALLEIRVQPAKAAKPDAKASKKKEAKA